MELPKSLLFELDVELESIINKHPAYSMMVAKELVKVRLLAAANHMYKEWIDSLESNNEGD